MLRQKVKGDKAMIQVGDKVKSSVIQDCDGTRPELEVIAVSNPNATGWTGLSPNEDRLVTVRDSLRGDVEVFIDTIERR